MLALRHLSLRHRAAALATATALATAPVLLAAAPAQAAGHHTARAQACTITSAQRAATLDEVHALQRQLAGHHLTAAERQAMNAAVAELRQAIRDGHLSLAARQAKRAEYAALAEKLDAAATPEERTAIRSEMTALRTEIAAARLTHAERRELLTEIADVRRAFTQRPTKARRAQILAQIRTLALTLRCRTV